MKRYVLKWRSDGQYLTKLEGDQAFWGDYIEHAITFGRKTAFAVRRDWGADAKADIAVVSK